MAARRLAGGLRPLVHGLEQEMGEIERLDLARIERALADRRASARRPSAARAARPPWGSRRSSRSSAARAGCRWSRWRSRSPLHGAPRSKARPLAASARRRSARRKAASRNCRARLRGTRRRASSGFGELAAAGPIGADEIGVAEIAGRLRAVLLRGPTTDCSRRSGRTRPRRPVCAPSPCSV